MQRGKYGTQILNNYITNNFITNMKVKTLLLIGLLTITISTFAQPLQFVVVYDEVVAERGELYQYSERYLGPTELVKEDVTYYRIASISPYMQPIVKPSKNTISSSGKPRIEVEPQIPLSETSLMAGSTAKKAECVAKQIYRIRETRMNILAGDVEHVPQDGKAMEQVLKELDKEEKALTALFVGKQKITTKRKLVTYQEGNELLLRFSRFAGPVDLEDVSGEPVYISVTDNTESRLAEEQPQKKSAPRIYENHIISRSITITYNEDILLDTQIQ